MARIVGRFNDIHETAKIADTARICGWCYVGPGVEIGENTVIGNFCEINSGTKIGADTLINSHCNLNSNTRVGSGVIFGGGVLTADEKHMTARTESITKKPCVIGNDCRIGQGRKPHLHHVGRSCVRSAPARWFWNLRSNRFRSGLEFRQDSSGI